MSLAPRRYQLKLVDIDPLSSDEDSPFDSLFSFTASPVDSPSYATTTFQHLQLAPRSKAPAPASRPTPHSVPRSLAHSSRTHSPISPLRAKAAGARAKGPSRRPAPLAPQTPRTPVTPESFFSPLSPTFKIEQPQDPGEGQFVLAPGRGDRVDRWLGAGTGALEPLMTPLVLDCKSHEAWAGEDASDWRAVVDEFLEHTEGDLDLEFDVRLELAPPEVAASESAGWRNCCGRDARLVPPINGEKGRVLGCIKEQVFWAV